MADIATVDQLDARGKRVLVRVDFNVPVADGVCSDDTRIRAALPTIEKLINEGARVILMSHLGRPSGEGFEEKFTLRPAALRLSELLGRPVAFASDTVGPDAQAKAAALQRWSRCSCWRTSASTSARRRTIPNSARSSPSSAKHTSTTRSARRTAPMPPLPASLRFCPPMPATSCRTRSQRSPACSMSPHRPFVAILGGSKVSDKIKVIDALMDKCDTLIIGGGMCFTFLLAQGKQVGTSLKEEDWVERAAAMMREGRRARRETAASRRRRMRRPVRRGRRTPRPSPSTTSPTI